MVWFLPCILISLYILIFLFPTCVYSSFPKIGTFSFPNPFLSQKTSAVSSAKTFKVVALRFFVKDHPIPSYPTTSSSLTLPVFQELRPQIATFPRNFRCRKSREISHFRDLPRSPFHRPDALTPSCKRVNRFLEAGQGGRKRRARETWPVSRPGRPPPLSVSRSFFLVPPLPHGHSFLIFLFVS